MELSKMEQTRMEQVLPSNIKESTVLSNNAKKVLAVIIDCHFALDKAKTNGHVYLSNDTIRNAVRIKKADMLSAIRELVDYKLIRREVGSKWCQGQQKKASEYYVNWENLKKPLEVSFDTLYEAFIHGVGTTDTDTDTETDTETDTDLHSNITIEPNNSIEVYKNKSNISYNTYSTYPNNTIKEESKKEESELQEELEYEEDELFFN